MWSQIENTQKLWLEGGYQRFDQVEYNNLTFFNFPDKSHMYSEMNVKILEFEIYDLIQNILTS